MNRLDLFLEALRGIRAHPLRSFLTLLGIIIAVTTIVSVVGIIAGLDRYMLKEVYTLAPDVVVISRFGMITSEEQFLEALKRKELSWQEYETLKRLLTKADGMAAIEEQRVVARYGDRRLSRVHLSGATANAAPLLGLNLLTGRFFLEGEDRARQAVCVIGWDLKDELFPNLDPIGRTVTFDGIPFKVIGLLARQGKTLGQSRDKQAFIPIQGFRQFFTSSFSLDFLVRARGGVAGVDATIDEIRGLLRAMRHTPVKSPDPFGVVSADAFQELWRKISTAAFILLFLISSVSLGISGVVIMNIMLVAVLERTQEIGVRLAVGAKEQDIRRQFLVEAVLLSLAGGLIGAAIGSFGAFCVDTFTPFPALVAPWILGMGLLLSSVVGILAGYLPAVKASRLVAVEALRTE